jgi:hypothetical protein
MFTHLPAFRFVPNNFIVSSPTRYSFRDRFILWPSNYGLAMVAFKPKLMRLAEHDTPFILRTQIANGPGSESQSYSLPRALRRASGSQFGKPPEFQVFFLRKSQRCRLYVFLEMSNRRSPGDG